jgi:UDP-N-acetylmuramyl pentapeptide phosphotransferase/UDP-N-acetylglucosamine-1-phosphate transferase
MTGGGLLHVWSLAGPIVAVASIVLTAALIRLLQAVLARYAVALPNARSSHKAPTSQGAVIATTAILVALTIYFVSDLASDPGQLAWILAATIVLAIVGALDDQLALEVLPPIWRLIYESPSNFVH